MKNAALPSGEAALLLHKGGVLSFPDRFPQMLIHDCKPWVPAYIMYPTADSVPLSSSATSTSLA